jgi:hypothetical protein
MTSDMGATMNAPANSSELILWRIMAYLVPQSD